MAVTGHNSTEKLNETIYVKLYIKSPKTTLYTLAYKKNIHLWSSVHIWNTGIALELSLSLINIGKKNKQALGIHLYTMPLVALPINLIGDKI